LSNQWDLAGLDRESMAEVHEHELQLCEKCGAAIGTKKHLVWLYEKLGPLAYTNPSLLLAKNAALWKNGSGGNGSERTKAPSEAVPKEMQTRDFMRILCPKCKCELNIRL